MAVVPHPPDLFLGREPDLVRLERALAAHRVVLLEGLSGVGKTSLLAALGRRLRAPVAWISLRSGGDWIEQLVAALPEESRLALTERPTLELREVIGLLNAAELTVLVDDFHLLEDLGEVLGVLKTYLGPARMVLATSERPPLPPIELLDFAEVPIQGLRPEDAIALLRHYLPDLPDARSAAGRLEGHPLLLKMFASLVREGLATAAQALEELTGTSLLGHLDADELETLRLLALARVPVNLSAAPALQSLARRFLIARVPEGWSLPEMVRRQLLAELTESDRVRLHLLLAVLVAPEQAIHHWLEAGRPDAAAPLLEKCGGSLLSRGHYAEVAAWTEQVPLTPRLMLLRSHALSVLGKENEALELLQELTGQELDDDLCEEVESALGGTYLNAGRLGLALRHFQRGASLKCRNYAALVQAFLGRCSLALAESRTSEEQARGRSDQGGIAHALRVQAMALNGLRRYEEARRAASGGLELARALRSQRLIGWNLLNLAGACTGLGDLECASQAVEEGLELGRRFADNQALGFFHRARGCILHARGELEPALEELSASDRCFILQGIRRALVLNRLLAGSFLLEAERLEEAAALFREEAPDILEPVRLELVARLHLLRGEPTRAARAAREILTADIEPLERDEARLLLAEASWRQGDLAVARAELEAVESEDASVRARASMLRSVLDLPGPRPDLSALTGSARRQALALESRLQRKRYRVLSSEGESVLESDQLAALRARAGDFSLFVDVPERRVVERERGEVDLLGKKIVSGILLTLMRQALHPPAQEDLFERVWEARYDPVLSPVELRKSISRLRELIEPEPGQWRYIKLARGLTRDKGRYCFDSTQPYCLIEELSG